MATSFGFRALALAGALVLSLSTLATAGTSPSMGTPPASQEKLNRWGRSYLTDWHRRHPGQATLDGIHAFDTRLASYAPQSLEEERQALLSFQRQLAAIPASTLPPAARLDWRLAQDNLAWRLLELDELRPWLRNPMLYADEISNGLLWLTLYPTAPASQRLRAVVAREEQIPRLLREARQNLQNPPAGFVSTAMESFEGLRGFVERDLPEAFKGTGTPKLQRTFQASTAVATMAIKDFLEWMEQDLKPRAHGAFALGSVRYANLLRHKEGISLPLDRLEAIGSKELAAKEALFRELAKIMDDSSSPQKLWKTQRKNHPAPGELLPEVRLQVEALEQFVLDRKLLAVPQHRPLEVAPTPPFLKGTFASQYMVGPFETKAVPARYFITLPDPEWTEAQQEDHLSEYSRGALWATSAHEAYPGHYLQGLYLRRNRSPFRRGGLFASDALVEGWAHYCEELMVEQGFRASDPTFHLGQVKEALLRASRFLVSIRLHTKGMTLEEATRFFMDHALMSEGPARVEAERGAYEPTYLTYTYGKLELLRLREDLRAREGPAFSLSRFHERVLRQGQVPMWFLREALLETTPAVVEGGSAAFRLDMKQEKEKP
jgi:uncharacterized protein (DUF885 family)